ncbi:MAG: hypothetical protein V3V24_00025, partial [Nitrospinaceae bacterium]
PPVTPSGWGTMDTPTTATMATAIIIITLPGTAGTNTRAATVGIIQAEADIKDTAETIILGNIVEEGIGERVEAIKARVSKFRLR